MDFRRLPFQFSSTDPAKRQAELQKRFGLPAKEEQDNIKEQDKMHLDFPMSGLMNMRSEDLSPGAERRAKNIPITRDAPLQSTVNGSPTVGRKPRVREVPIQILGDDAPKPQQHFSGHPANSCFSSNGMPWFSKSKPADPASKPSPREHTIPIQVEGSVLSKKAKTVPDPTPKPSQAEPTKNDPTPTKTPKTVAPSKKEPSPKQNGCTPSKGDKPKKPNILMTLGLKRVDGILEKLKTYHTEVEAFSGTLKDKQYRYLDEMLTRLMLELDNVDTRGIEEVRLARKAAVRQVQASLDLLEAKVTAKEKPTEEQDVEMVSSSQEVGVDGAIVEPDGDADSTMADPSVEGTVAGTVDSSMADSAAQDEEKLVSSVDQCEVPKNDSEVDALPEVSSSDAISKGEVMDVDITSEFVDSEIDANKPMSSEQSGLRIEEIDSESVNETEPVTSTNEPVVSEPDSPVKELEHDAVNSTEVSLESSELSNTIDGAKELISKTCQDTASNENNSNVESAPIQNGHSSELCSEQSL